jgi:carbamoyl-phosphate synthase large subunit
VPPCRNVQIFKSILIIGAGPIVIGQACEFDYSGAQACKALREEGYRVILVNSNPATIMTDPEMADATYIEPVNWQTVEKIIEKERPDAILPTMGGQTALNCALDLDSPRCAGQFNVEMIGAKGRHRHGRRPQLFRQGDGLSVLKHRARPSPTAWKKPFRCRFDRLSLHYPAKFHLGGSGGGIAYNREEFEEICQRGLDLSPTNELLIDESLLGWKEYEMEVVRDRKDNCIIVCSYRKP